jgi:hypothetical protein
MCPDDHADTYIYARVNGGRSPRARVIDKETYGHVVTVSECPANRCKVLGCTPKTCLCHPCACLRCRGRTLRARNGRIHELATVAPARYEQLQLVDHDADRRALTDRILGERDHEGGT